MVYELLSDTSVAMFAFGIITICIAFGCITCLLFCVCYNCICHESDENWYTDIFSRSQNTAVRESLNWPAATFSSKERSAERFAPMLEDQDGKIM